ncbi:hypothetical protein IWQ57_000402 [Coemansia nantahalensis]|uniref:Uncharacterized protein n=1 Tax=Coemansia nantahalensis TaxID=2789366 RepID=A0ACC1K823_9FUNG|nr:hypothetical protein IWQ57_000402 [Coemansia nantahalensis]
MVAADGAPIAYDISAYAELDAELHAAPERFLDRYYSTSLYECPVSGKRKHPADGDEQEQSDASDNEICREWQYVRMANNRLCVVGLADSHPLYNAAQRAQVGDAVQVEFAESVKGSVIRGKGKKQALRVMPNTKLCTIRTQATEYTVRAAVKGVLLETIRSCCCAIRRRPLSR